MAPQTTTRLTFEDYQLLPDDGRRHEILDGEHYVNPSPNMRHQEISMNLLLAIAPYVREHALGHVFHPPLDVVLSETDVVQPDMIFISNERAKVVLDRGQIRGAPDLVVEILSESSRRYDEIMKRKQYEIAGVSEYWIIDHELESVKIYRRDGAKLTRTAEITTEAGGTITTPLLPGLAVDVTAIFAVAE